MPPLTGTWRRRSPRLADRRHYTLLHDSHNKPPGPVAGRQQETAMAPPDTASPAPPFRAPAFNSHDPNMWFTILELNFKANNITEALKQFTHACTLLPPEVLLQVSDAIAKAPSSDNPYDDLKQAVLKRLASSVSTRLQELLKKEELGNEKPSDLLRRMKRLLGDQPNTMDKTMFAHLFYQRLPPALQSSLFSVKDKLDLADLAQLADDYMSTVPSATPPSSVATVTNTADVQQLTHIVSQLALQVSAMQEQLNPRQRRRSPSPRRPRYRSRSRSTTRTPGVCYYHSRFGSEAIKCTQPCTYNTTPASN